MKLMKKALAMFLALVMIFSTMAVSASAAYPGDDANPTLDFSIRYFRKVDGVYNQITDGKVKPGEDVYARFYAKTNYIVNTSDILILYDKQFFDYQLTKDNVETDDVRNKSYSMIESAYVNHFENRVCPKYTTALIRNYISDENAKSYGFSTLEELNLGLGYITSTVAISYKTSTAFDDSVGNYLFEIPFKVKDNEYVRSNRSASMYIPLEYLVTYDHDGNFTSVPMVDETDREVTYFMDEFEPGCIPTSTPASLSVEGTAIFDANGGSFADGTTKTTQGVIGDSVTLVEESPELAKHDFKGWSKVQNAPFAADATINEGVFADLATLKYGSEDVTLYAVWQKQPPKTIQYEIKVYEMGTDGQYPETATSSTDGSGAEGTTASVTPEAKTGFTIDETKSNLSVELTDEAAAVPTINVYYKRNQHNAIYNVDNTQVHSKEAFYGASVPGLENYTVPAGKEITWTPELGSVVTMPDEDVIFNGTLSDIDYYYTFNALAGVFEDGAPAKMDRYTYGQTPTSPEASLIAPEGYEFDKWINVDTKEDFSDDEVVEDAEFDAVYKAIDYTVTFKKLGADGITETLLSDLTLTEKHIGDTITLPALPTPAAGLEISGWYKDNVKLEGTSFVMPAADVTLFAKEGKIPCTYSYIADEGEVKGKFEDGSSIKTQDYFYGDTPTILDEEPIAPEGYEFVGWNADLPEKVEGDIRFIADYVPIEYSLTYEIEAPEGVDIPAPAEENGLNIGSTVDIAALPVVEGYEPTNANWLNGSEEVAPGSEFTMPASDVVLKATYKVKTNDIIFDAAGGAPVASIEDVPFNTVISDLPTTTKDDYDFVAWSLNGVNVTSVTMPDEDVTLVAVWKQSEYSITYSAKWYQGADEISAPAGAPALPTAAPSKSGESISVAAVPTFEGYTFDGWKLDGTTVTTFTMPKHSVELVGEWHKNGGNLGFYFAKNEDGTPAGTAYSGPEWLDEGEPIVLPAEPEQTGSDFIKWVDKDGNDLPDAMPNGDFNAFAVFELHKHSVTYYDADGITVLQQFTDVPYGSETPKAADPVPPTHDDPLKEFYFAGWNEPVPAVMPDQALEFTATYLERLKGADHVATYISDGTTVAAYTIHAGEPMQKPADPTKFGHKFVGWDPAVPDVMPNEDVTFVAVWESDLDFNPVIIGGVVVAGAAVATIAAINTALITGAAIIGGVVVITGIHHVIEHSYNVTYKVNGEVYRTFRIIEGTRIIVPKDPTKEGATFKGWNPEVPERMPAHDLVFEAVWSDSNPDNPATGSTSAGLAAFAAISSAAVAAYLVSKKKKEDEE